jgi:stage V sporulation protein B
MEQVKKFAFDVGWVLFSSAVTLLIGFLLRIVLARWLGAADLGLYTMVVTIQGITELVATLGIPVALIKYTAEHQDDRDRLFRTTSAAFISSVILGLVFGLLMYGLSGTLAGAFHMPELAHLLKILAFVFPLASVVGTLLGLSNGLRQMKTYAYLMIFRSLLMILLVVALVWLGFGVEGAVLSIVLSTAGGCIFGLYFLRKYLRLNLQGFVQNVKKLVLFGSQVFGANLLSLVIVQMDIIMIGYFLAAQDVGYYSVAVSLSTFFLLIPQAIQRITYPATSEYWSKNNHQALREMIDKSMKYSACILLPLGLGVGFFANELITGIFGQEFVYAVLPLLVLLITRVIMGSSIDPVGACYSGVGRPDLVLKLNAVAAAMNIGLNILLIPHFGILGAAVATAISLLTQDVIFLALMPKILATRIDIKWYAKALGFACIAIILFLAGIRLINPYVVGGVILCAYIILVFMVLLTKEDKNILKSLASSLLKRR